MEPSIHLIYWNVTFCITTCYFCSKEQCTFCETPIQLQIGGERSAFVRAGALFSLDLWWLQGVGRSSCDYCLHTDLYLTFNYLRGLALLMPIHPSFCDQQVERRPLWFPPRPFSLSVVPDRNRGGTLHLWQQPIPPPVQNLGLSQTFPPRVGSKIRLYGNVKLLFQDMSLSCL